MSTEIQKWKRIASTVARLPNYMLTTDQSVSTVRMIWMPAGNPQIQHNRAKTSQSWVKSPDSSKAIEFFRMSSRNAETGRPFQNAVHKPTSLLEMATRSFALAGIVTMVPVSCQNPKIGRIR